MRPGHAQKDARRWLKELLPLQSYHKYRVQRGLRQKISGTVPVLVFSLGKVGTTSLARLLESELDVPVVHCHRIAARPTHTQLLAGQPRTTKYRSAVAWRGDYIRKVLERDTKSRCDIVCGVRDPLSRSVSVMFQVGDRFGLFDQGATEADQIASVAATVHDAFRCGSAELGWFDSELRAVTGIDVYAEPFPHAAGYKVYEQGRFRVLLLRYEDLNRVGPSAISQFFSIDVREFPKANRAADKTYGDLYRRFLDQSVMPVDVLDAAYNSSLARHFYSDAERAEFRARWHR